MAFNWHYFFSLFSLHILWQASLTVIELSVLSWGISLVLGFVVASLRQTPILWVQGLSQGYIWLFRSVPLLVLVVFIYNLPQVIPASSLLLSNAFIAGLIATVVVETAYMAEIHRGGLLAVAKGQREAAYALGLRYTGTQRLVIIPQALRIAFPSLFNEFVTIIKQTSLVSVISLPELLMTAQRLYAENFLVLETLAGIACYYVMIVSLFTLLFWRLEKQVNLFTRQRDTLNEDNLAILRRQAQPLTFKAPEIHSGRPDALILKNIHKSYGQHSVLNGIDLKIAPGEVVSIIGPSGSGKTSLIRTVNGLESLDKGEVILFGQPFIAAGNVRKNNALKQNIRRIGMVFHGV